MPNSKTPNAATLTLLLDSALQGEFEPLQGYLLANGRLAREMMNLALIKVFADLAAQRAMQPTLLPLLDRWAALDPHQAPVDSDQVIFPCVGVRSYGHIAAVHPSAWDEMVERLHRAASDSRWRVREMVAMAFQAMLSADWDRAYKVLHGWLTDSDPLVIRAIVAAVAEPPILTEPQRCKNTVAIMSDAVNWLSRVPESRRSQESVRVLRQALGYTVSVAAAAEPEGGFALLERMATQPDKDLQWIVRENLKKNRLKKWPEQLARLQESLS